MYTETRHFSWFVARDCRKNPCAERISTVSLVEVPHLYLNKRYQITTVVVYNHIHNCSVVLGKKSDLQEGLFRVHLVLLIQGCCAVLVGRGVLHATCMPEKTSTAGSVSKARFSLPYVSSKRLRNIAVCLLDARNTKNRECTTGALAFCSINFS